VLQISFTSIQDTQQPTAIKSLTSGFIDGHTTVIPASTIHTQEM